MGEQGRRGRLEGCRGEQAAGKTVLLGVGFSWWAKPGPIRSLLKFELAIGLIVKLQNLRIMFNQIHERQFITMALKMDAAPHFDGRICSAHIANSTLHMASRG
jgi:hypothetical protein